MPTKNAYFPDATMSKFHIGVDFASYTLGLIRLAYKSSGFLRKALQ